MEVAVCDLIYKDLLYKLVVDNVHIAIYNI